MSLMFSFVVAFAIASILAPSPTNAQEDVATSGSAPEYFLVPHNRARADAGLPPLEWDPKLEQYAQKTASRWGENCELEHSDGPYGENIAGGTGSVMTGTDATNMWLSEKEFYNPVTKSCAEGQECGNYLNIVSPLTAKVGCAKIYCPKNDGLIWQCDYSAE